MSDFSDDWLATRESADHSARDAALLARLTRWFDRRSGRLSDRQPRIADNGTDADRPIRIVDLGSGSGSNLRYLVPRLTGAQHWRLVDNDATLLSAMPTRIDGWAREHGLDVQRDDRTWTLRGVDTAVTVEPVALDLSSELDAALPVDTDIVTASALLDLFSEERLRALADACRRTDAACLFALSYDGRVEWWPAHERDARSVELFNAHQRRDKGLGGAAGPDAHAACEAAFSTLGYEVATARADWRLGPDDAALQRALLDGWLEAVTEQAPAEAEASVRWHAERLALIDERGSTLRVGHVDLLALPPEDVRG